MEAQVEHVDFDLGGGFPEGGLAPGAYSALAPCKRGAAVLAASPVRA